MEYTHLGRSGLRVSRLCLGTMNFGPKTAEDAAHAIMDRALLDHGITFFDTADVYGWRKGEGWTEQIIGNWFASGGGRREQVVLATKAYGSMGDNPNDTFLSARHIRLACEGSLRRLRTDWIDLYQMHHIDRDTPFDEIWEAMTTLRQQGKILYVGSSNFAGWHIAAAQEAAHRRNLLGLVAEQSLYNLLQRTIELEVLPAARHYGLGLIPWSPLGGGALGGILAKQARGESEGRSTDRMVQDRLARYLPKIEAYEAFCAEIGAPPTDVGLAWLLHQEGVTAPIIGPRTVEQLDSSLPALDLELTPEHLARLDEISPGHRPAPEDYAW